MNPETEEEQRSETTPDPEERPIEERTPETQTSDSYHTPPVSSEPAEHLFAAILEHPRSPLSEGPTEQPITPEPKTKKEMTAPGPGPMNVDNAKKGQELKLNQPKPFDGKRGDLDEFIQDVQLYLTINDDVYDSDKKKIAYTLSFMSEGDAKSWKGQFLRSATTAAGIDLGNWKQFLIDLRAAFQPYDASGDALEELTTLKMGTNTSIEDHIAKYKILLARSGVLDTSPSAIDYFRKTLNIPLQKKLLELPTPPTNLKEWYDWAARLDNNYRKMQWIFGRGQTTTNNGKGKEEPRRRWNFQRKDPNAMDVDVITTTMNAMTVEEREKFMKEGLCFRCRKPGHISRDCPLKKGNVQILTRPATAATPIPPKKMKGAELVAHIRSLTTGLDKEEMKEFMDLAEETGF